MKTRYLFLIFSFCFCYCTPNNRYKEIVHEMHGKEIVFPEGLKKWRENGFDHNVAYDYQDKKRKIVVYFSSLTCNVCNLGKIGNWKKLEKEFKNVEFIYILSYDSLNHSNRFIHPSPLNLLTKSVQLASKIGQTC